jgi:hypothetical protein
VYIGGWNREEMTALGTRRGKSKDEKKMSYKNYDFMWTAFIFPEVFLI